MLPKALRVMNGTRPYKTAYGHDMSCPYVIEHTLFGDQIIESIVIIGVIRGYTSEVGDERDF